VFSFPIAELDWWHIGIVSLRFFVHKAGFVSLFDYGKALVGKLMERLRVIFIKASHFRHVGLCSFGVFLASRCSRFCAFRNCMMILLFLFNFINLLDFFCHQFYT